jgi:hypothetical protein
LSEVEVKPLLQKFSQLHPYCSFIETRVVYLTTFLLLLVVLGSMGDIGVENKRKKSSSTQTLA